MKRKKNSIVICCIVLLLIGAYAVPMVLTVWEDSHLQSKTKSFEIEEIKLNFSEEDLTEKLAVFQKLLAKYVVVHKEAADLQNSRNYETMKTDIEEFLSLLNSEKTVDFQKIAATAVVMADIDTDKVYQLVQCSVVDANENKYMFWLDEVTGMVIAFKIPAAAIQMNGEAFYKTTEKLANYYGFPSFEILGPETSSTNNVSWEGAFWFVDDAQGKELLLKFYKNGDIVSFNMHPGEITVYDGAAATP